MAESVIDGVYYYGIDDSTHTSLVNALADDPDNEVLAGLVAAFNYKSKYVNGMWYAPFGDINLEGEIEWVENNTDEFLYVFHNSQQPSWGI